MKTQMKMILAGVIVLMSLMTVALTKTSFQSLGEIKELKEETRALTSNVRQLERENEHLSIQLNEAHEVITAQKSVVAQYNQLSEFIDLDAIDMSSLENVKKISDATPLSYEDAMVLVKHADANDIPYSLVLSIIELESNFQKDLVGASQDRGYMQIIPASERYLATKFGEELGLTYDPSRIFEAEYNLALGIKYIDMLRDTHGNDYERILSEYNRGPGNLAKYYAAYNTYSTSYSRKVLSKQQKYLALNN